MRWTIIILVVLGVLLGAAVLIVHLVLQSDFLGETILSRASERIGMEVTAESLHVGWGGTTTIRGLTVTMPLTGKVILSAENVRLAHTTVPLLLFRRPFHLRSIEVEDPQLDVRRDQEGRWNLQDAWTHIRAGLRSPESPRRRVALPRLVIHDALIHIAGPNEPVRTVGPLEFLGRPQGPLLWTFDLKMPEMGEVDGRLAEGGDWAHEANFTLEDLGPLVHDLFHRDLAPLAVTGSWQGSVVQGRVAGMLQLDKAAVGPALLHGDVGISADANGVTLRPQQLVLSEPNRMEGQLHIVSGDIRITPQAVIVEQLAARSGTLGARVNGRWDMVARTGRLSGSWAVNPPGPTQYFGTVEGAVKSPPLGRVQAEMTVTAQAQPPVGQWGVVAEVQGAGATWRRTEWQVRFPQLGGSRDGRGINLGGAAARLDVNWPVIRLASLHLPDAEKTNATAQFDAATRRWSVHADVNDLRLQAVETSGVDLLLSAEGNDRTALISELRVAAGARVATVRGNLSLAERGFQNLSVQVDWPARAPTAAPQPVQPGGQWHWEAHATGRLQPLAIDMEGELTGRNVLIGKQMVPRVAIPLHATANRRQVQMATGEFDLLSGQWQASGRYDLSTNQTRLSLIIDNISLEAAAGIAGSPLVSQGTAQAQVQLAMLGFDLQQAVATGQWSARDINVAPLHAETARGKLRVAGGRVQFKDISFEQEDGRAHGSIEFRLDHPQNLSIQFATEAWPIRLPDRPLALSVNSQADLQVDLATRSAQGQARLSGEILLDDRNLARIEGTTFIEGRILHVQGFRAEVLDGVVEGEGRIPLSRLTDSTADVKWRGIRPYGLHQWWPQFAGFGGEISGGFLVEPTNPQTRPLAPTRFTLNARAADGHYGPAQIQSCHVVGYLTRERLLIDEAVVQALGGRIDARARLSEHAGGRYGSLAVDVNAVSLNQIVRAIDPNGGPYAGLISGKIHLLSSSEPLAFGGEANLKLTQSDLANNPIIGTLHGILNLQIGRIEPKGTGQVKIRFEGPAIVISSFEYFNQGVEIRGAGRIGDIPLGGASPISGYAVGSSRVLKGVSLPGVSSLDRLMTTLQKDAASVEIGGTLDDPKVKVVPVPVISGSLRRLLWAQLHH